MSSRPDIELALDVRSHERVVVLASSDSEYEYPEHWIRPSRAAELEQIDEATVVIVDRAELQRRTLTTVAERRPRLLAVSPNGVEGEKAARRMLTSLFPWSEVWTIQTAFGRLLVTKDAVGPVYDREQLVDMRTSGAA